MSKDKIKSLYDTFVADGYEMESEDEFRTNLGDPNKRKAAYDALVADGYEMESYEDFENNIGFGLESYARSLGIGEETIKKAKEWLGGTTAQPSAQPSAQQTQAKKQTFDDVLAEAKDYDMTATKDAPKDGVLTTYVPGEIIGQQKQRPLYSKDILKSKMDNDLADAYSERVLDGKTDGYVPRMEREAWDERNRKMHEDMDKMAEGIANSRADVDSSLERIETELKDRLDNVENYSSRYSTMGGGYIGNMDTGVGRMSEDTQNLTIARDLLKEAQDIRKSGELNEEGLWGNTKDAGRTFINTITDFDTWDAGLKSTQEGQRLLAILDKAETEQPLTRSEEQLLDAWLANTIVQSSTKTGAGRTIGQTVGQMAPFVLEMMLNPASGIGKASTRALMRKVGNQISKRFLRRATAVGTRLATDAVGAGVMAGTTGAGHVVGGAYERMAQDPTLSFGQALGTSYVDRTIENWSEMFGAGMLSPLSSKAMAWTTRAARKGGQNGLGKWMSKGVELTNKVKGSKVGRAISEINKAARKEGPVEEYLEEVVGNATRATLGIDGMEFSTKEGKGVFNLEDNVVTFLSVAVPGVAQAAVNTTAYGIGNLYTKRKLNNADKHGMDAFGDRWDGIRRILDSIDYNDPIQVMMSLSRIQTNDEAEARIVADYAKAKGMRSGFESASSNVLQDNAETASAQGAQAETPQEVRRVGKSLSEAQSAIIGINGGESIKSAIDNYIADGAEDISQVSAVLDGLSESDREVAEDYFLARTRMQSYADKVQEIIDDAVSQEEERLAPYIYGGDSELEYDANGDIVRDEDGNAVERTTPRIFAEAVITPVNAHLKDEEPYSVMLTNYYPDSPFVTYVDANGVPQMVKRDDANIEVIEHDYDEYMAEYRAKIEADADARADMMLEHNERTNRAMNIGETIETLNGQMTVLNNDGQGNVTLAPVQLNSKGETEVVRGSQPVTMSAREAMALQDEYYERPTEVADNSQSAEVVDNMSANQAQNEGISNGENEQNVSKPTVEPIPTVQNGKKSRVAYEQVPVARTIEEVYGQFDEQEEVDEFIDLNIAEAEAAVKNASKPKPKMSTDIEAYKQAKAKWQEEQAGLAEAQKRLDYWKEVKAESERMQGLDTTTEISQDTKKEDNAPRSAMEYVASMIGRLDPGSYRKETGYGVKEQRKAGPIFLKKENGGMTVEGLAEWICEQPEAQEWGIQPGMDSEVRDMIIEVLSHGSPKAYIRDAHAQQAKADAYGEEQYLENMAAAQGYASADDMIAHDEVFLAEAIRAHYGLDENEYYANLAEEYEQEDNRKYGQGNERQDNGTSAERLGQSNTTAEVADVSGSSEVLSEEQSADTAGAESGNEQRELSGSTESGNEGTAENEAVSGEPVEQEPSVAPEQQAVVERVGQWEQQLGVKVNVITDASEVENETVREQLREKKEGDSVKGWFDPKTGEAYVYLPDNHSVEDVDETIIHEVIAHKGLRGLLGRAKFNKLCDAVWGSMSAKDKARFLSYVDGKVGNVRDQRAAADEYIAHLAEKMDKAELTKAEKGIWQTIVDYIMDALEKVGIKVTDKQIEALIKASYANMVSKASQTADTKDLLEYAQRDVERRAMLRKVYHGTGAEFDKFDHSFMSTGEGNQAFGWGTYVSEVEDVAKSYATTNHEENAEYESAKVKLDEAQKKWDEFGGQMYDKYGVTYTEKLNDEEKAKNKELLDAYNTAKSEMNSHAVARRLYTVEIPDDNGSNYIVYDKDVPKKMKDEVKRRLYNVLIEEDYKGAEKELKRELDNLFAMDMDGNNLYGNVSAYLGGDKNASEFLNSMGFVGIKYPVGSLSGVKSDASNYVIFNEEDAKIEGHMRFRKLKEVNDKFNAELQQQIDGTLPAGHIYQLGMPSDVLKSAGINDLPIELAASRLVDKSMQENHPFDLAEVENLPNAIHNPLAVFLSASNVGSKVLLTELKHGGKNFVVALRVRPNKKRIKVNQIRSLYPKDIKGLLNWINNDLATYVDKPRMIEWIGIQKNELLSKPQSNSVEVRKQLVSATKVIEEFENPKLSEENEETKFKKYKSKDGKETAYRQLSLFDTEGEASNDRSRTNSVQREGDSRLATLNSLRELEEGEVCNVERRFSEKGGFDFTRGEKVLFVEDVAYIFKNLEDEAIENSFVAFVKGDEVTVMHVGMGAQTMTVTDQTAVIAGAERLNADKVFFVHNHPSGKLVCSREDINLYTSLKMALGDKLWDGIIINTRSGKYGVFNENGIVSSGEEHISPQKEYPLKIYGFNKQAFHGDVVNIEPSSSGIAKFVSTQRLGSRNKINALLLNNSFGCLGNVFLSETDITEKNAYPVMQKLVADAISMGARSIVLYGRAPFVYFTGGKLNLGSRLSEYVKMLSSGQIQLQDVIQLGEGSYTSAIDDGIRFRKANRNQVGFVSNAMVAVENVKQEKATPEQWLKMIEKQGGLKAGEDKWLGLSDWLKSLSPNPSPNGEGNSKPRVVTKDEVLEFIGENMIQIEEVTYGDGMPKHAQEKLDELNEEFQALIWEGDEETGSVYTSDWVDYAWSAMVDRYGDDIDGAFEIEGNGTNAELVPMLDYNDEMVDQAKYFLEINDYTSRPINSTRLDYTTEGLENKREIALTVPTIESWNESDEIHFGDAGDGRAVAWIRFGETTVYEESKELKDAKNALEELKEKYDGQLVRNPNMTKEDENLAKELNKKIRELLLEGEAGDKRVLVIDEIQSKRHQEGREKGYVDKSRMDEIRNLVAKNDERLNEITPSIKTIYNGNKELGLSGAQKQHEEAVSKLPKEQRSEYDKLKEENYSLTEEFTSLQKAGETGVPSAPFEKNWHELAMKRMLRLAAEEGFDKVAWTTGEQQAERYDVGTVIKSIKVGKVYDQERGMREIVISKPNRYKDFLNINKDGIIEDALGEWSFANGKSVEEVFGKELGGKIRNSQPDNIIEGNGLRLGGEGMKGFYDKMLPSFVQKYTKKWGAKVGEVTLPNLEESAQKMWSVDVTPQMKESVGEQVMFSKRTTAKEGFDAYTKDFKTDGINITLLYSPEDYYRYAIDVLGANEEEADEFVELVKENKIGGLFLSGTNEIALFADNIDNAYSVLFHEHTHLAVEKLGDINRFAELASELSVIDEELADRIGQRYRSEDIEKEVIAYTLQYALEGGAMSELRAVLSDNSKALLDNLLNYIGYDTGKDYKKEVERQEKREGSNLVKRQQRTRNQVRRFSGLRGSLLEEGRTPQGLVEESAKKEGVLKGFDALAYAQQKVKEREDEVRMRKMIVDLDKAEARREYESMLDTEAFRFQEAFQDSMLGLKALQEAVAKANGKSEVADWENAYIAENQLSSINHAEQEAWRRLVLGKLLDEVKSLMMEGATHSEISDYLMAKHGLERNEKFAERDAREEYKEIVKKIEGEIAKIEKQLLRNDISDNKRKSLEDELKKKQDEVLIEIAKFEGIANYMNSDAVSKWYKAVRKAIETSFTNGNITQEEYQKRVAKWDDLYINGYKNKYRGKDYSGLTTMFENEDVAEAERLASEFVNQFEQDHDTQNLWSAVKGATKSILDKQLKSGLISKETYDLTDKMFEWYVPLRGFDETTSDEVYDYLDKGSIRSTLSMPIRHAKGRGSKADDPIATIANMAESGIMVGNKNVMKQKFLNLVENNPSDLVSIDDVWVEKRFNPSKGEDEWVQVLPDYTGLTTAEEIEQARATFEASMEARHKADPKSVLRGREAEKVPYKVVTSKQMNEHQVVVKRGGKTYVLTINGNPRAAQALNGLTNPHGSENPFIQETESLNRWLASMFTSRNPAFIFANLVRDGIYANQSVWAKESAAYAIKYNQNWNKALASLPKLIKLYKQNNLDLNNPEHKMFYDFITNGGETGYSKLTSVEEYKKHIGAELGEGKRDVLEVLDKGLDTFNRWAEGVSRYSAFKTSREMGRSVQRSIYDAKEISVNFNKKGAGASVAGKYNRDESIFSKNNRQVTYAYASQGARMLYVFWNAGVQGLTNFGKIAKKNPKKFLAWAGTQFVAGACMPLINSVLASMFGDDDDDYWNIPEYIRRNNVCIFDPVTGGYIKIPMPIELRAIYGLGELMAGQMLGKTDFKGMELTKQVAGQISQILPIDMMEGDGGFMAFVPSYVKPIAEILANKDWTGIPLKKDYDYNKNMPEWTKAYKGTNPWLVGLSEAVNDWTGGNKHKKGAIDIDPSAVQHLFEGYFGGVGKMISQTFDTASLLWSKDMREGWTWGRNAPIINRFYTSSDKRAEEKRITSDWWRHKDEMDIVGQQYNGFKRDMKTKDAVEYAKAKEELRKLMESDEYGQYVMWKEYDKKLNKLNEALKKDVNNEELKERKIILQENMNEIFKKAE